MTERYVNPLDIGSLNKALEWIRDALPEDGDAAVNGNDWWPMEIRIWNEATGATAGWIRWHGDGFWAVEPVLYDMPGGEDD